MRHGLIAALLALVSLIPGATIAEGPASRPAPTKVPTGGKEVQSRVTRGDLIMYIPVRGTVEADDVVRVRSQIDGRVEIVKASVETWYHPEDELGLMATSQLAALLDSNHTTPEETLEERWKGVFPLNPLRCPDDCFVLSISAKPKVWTHPGEVLFRVAKTLRLQGALADEIPDGEHASDTFEMWPVSDPSKRVRVFIERLSPRHVTALLPFGANFAPGSAWEGRVEVVIKRNVLKVPTSALLHFKGETYLPLRVIDGITVGHETEIKFGAKEGDELLILKPDEWAASVAPAPLPPPAPRKAAKKPSAEPGPPDDSGLYAMPDKPAKEPVDEEDDSAQ